MLRRYQRTIGDLFRVFDASIIVGAWLLAYWERFHGGRLAVTKGLPDFEVYAALCPLIAVLWAATFESLSVYESRRLVNRLGEVFLLMRAHITALLLFIAITYMFDEYRYSRGVIIYFAVLGAVGIASARFALRSLLRAFRARGYNLRHVLVVGDGATLQDLVNRIDCYPELGLRVAGVATAMGEPTAWSAGKPVFGCYADAARIVGDHKLDEVIVALGARESDIVDHLLDSLRDEPVALRVVPDVQRYITLGCEVEDFDGVPVVRLNDSPLIGLAALAKRGTDIIISAIGLTAVAPLLALIALAVKATSKGPVFYGQERMGLDGRTFIMYKFRSMRVDAERASGAVWCTKNDDRRTPIGSFLRKTSIDELPELWNVLRGDMSLVGPRPERPVFVNQFRHEIPNYMIRHKVKSGITGWAQVNGWRGDTSLSARIECDLFYIRNWSYFMDLRILLMTVWKGFVNKNAY